MTTRLKRYGAALIGFLGLLLVWSCAVRFGNFPPQLFPPPGAVLTGFLDLFHSGLLWESIAKSFLRFFAGYLSSSAAAMLLGLLLGRIPAVWRCINPVIQILRPISPIAWLPFIVLWFGIGDVPAIVIVCIAAFFPVLLSTVSGVQKVDPNYLRLAQNLGLSRFKTLKSVIFPAAFPQIASGLHLAIGSAWVFIVAGEMLGAQSGLGFLIVDARNNLRSDLLLATMLLIGFAGLLLDSAIVALEKRIYRTWGVQARD